jgi:hypothetical protein
MGAEMTRAPQPKCGALVAGAFAKVMDILVAHGFNPTQPGKAFGD